MTAAISPELNLELSRLQPMPDGYNEALFINLHSKTKDLRRKLARNIDCRKFGIDVDIVESWFENKFIYVFSKYCQEKGSEELKAYIINSLQVFQKRVMRVSYQRKFEVTNNSISIDGMEPWEQENVTPYYEDYQPPEKLKLALSYLKKELSPDAYMIMELDLYPPPYIITQMNKRNKSNFKKIPANLIAEFIGIGDNKNAISWVTETRKEIRESIKNARIDLT